MKKNQTLTSRIRTFLLVLLACTMTGNVQARKTNDSSPSPRQQWADLCYRIARPVLENMSRGELQKNMQLELSPTWDGRDRRVAYMETFGRLMAGISPWLSLPDDDTLEGRRRSQLRQWALKAYRNAVDPASPDCLLWKGPTQILVDAAYLAESFLRAPEAFLMSIGEEADQYALTVAVNKINEWYLSDGWYSDGPEMALDYYNSYVIHPMYIEVLETCKACGFWTPVTPQLAVRRMQRFNVFLERLISPEGTYPAFGRSVVYRMGAFQTLAMAAWKYGLPEGISNGQVRSALTAVMKNMFAVEGNFNSSGFLQLGFAGHQPGLANYYTNNGSLYMTSLVFMPLGLPADHPFWTDPAEPWTSQKAWSGQPFPIDGHHSLRTE